MKRVLQAVFRNLIEMMDRAFTGVVCTLIVMAFLTPLIRQTRQAVREIGKTTAKVNDTFTDQQRFWNLALPKTLGKVDSDLDAAHDTIVQSTDTLKAGNDLLVAMRSTNLQAAATIQQIGDQMAATNADAQKFVQAATQAANATTSAVQEATETERVIHDLAANADWAKTLANVQRGTSEGAGVVKDLRIEADNFTAKKTTWQKIKAVGGFAAKIAICKEIGIGCTIQ